MLMYELKGNQGIIDGTELYTRIKKPVVVKSSQTPLYSDISMEENIGGDFIFIKVQNR